MRIRNDGKEETNILQNQFTAYLVKSLRRRKISYLKSLSKVVRHEISMDIPSVRLSEYEGAELLQNCIYQFESALLIQALEQLAARDRFILFTRVFDDGDFRDLAQKLNLSYKGVTTAYYRTIRKLIRALGKDDST